MYKFTNFTNYIKLKIHKFISWIRFELFYIKFEIKDYVFTKIERFYKCKNNLSNWRKVICVDDQKDFIYLLLILKKKLELIEKEWGTHTDHENDYEEKEKLQELINTLEKMINIALLKNDVSKDENYQKLSKSFFNKLHRLHDKLWS